MTEPIHVAIKDIITANRQRAGFDKGRASRAADTKARLAPCEAVVRTEIDIARIDGHPTRGMAARIAKRIKFHPVIQEYRVSNDLPNTQRALTQWTARILARIMK